MVSGRKVASSLGRAWELFPFSLAGLAVAGAAAALLLRFGRARSDYVAYAAALLALAFVALCGLVTVLAALVVWLGVRRAPAGLPLAAETLKPVESLFRHPSLALWPLAQVSMRWDEPAGVRVTPLPLGRRAGESVVFGERGHVRRVVRRFTVTDIFGLSSVSFPVAWEHRIRVVPARGAMNAELAAGRASGDAVSHPAGRQEGELIEMRRYGPGDPLRHVLWKTYARTRRLLVRMPERAISPRPTTAAILVAGRGDEPAASTARLFVEGGLLGADFLFAADGAARPTGRVDEALEQIVGSIAFRGDGGCGFAKVARTTELPRFGSCLVFAPPVDGPWRERLVAFARNLPSPPTVIVGIDGPIARPRRGRLGRLLVLDGADAPSPLGAAGTTAALCAALRSSGLRVAVLHRATGQMLSDEVVREL